VLSGLKPQFDKIERYYYEIHVALLVEQECLGKISRSLHVTPDHRLRWENIHDACRAASTLLTPGVGSTLAPAPVPPVNQAPPPPPFMSQQTVST